MRLVNMIILLLVIQATIILYDQVYSIDDGTYTLPSYGSNDAIIWNFTVNPSSWSSDRFLLLLLGLVSGTSLIGIGTYLYTKSDTILFFSIFTLLLGFGAIPLISLYSVFQREVSFFGCETMKCTPAMISWLLTGGTLTIMYVMACIEWWSGRSTG